MTATQPPEAGPPEAAPPEAAEPPAPTAPSGSSHIGRRQWIGLGVLSIGVSMIIVDGTIVSVATPSIIDDLGLDLSDAQWLSAIYSLVFASLLITVGRVGDRFGRRRLFLLGLVTFVVASVLAGTAASGTVLFAARFVQGVGAAMMLPSSLSTVNAVFTGRSRAIAFAVWGSVIAGMAAVGPVLGGWLTTDFSWRWAFFINIPIGLVVIMLTLRYVDETRDRHPTSGWDPIGTVTSIVGAGLFVFALIEGSNLGWWAPESSFSVAGLTWPDIGISIVPVAFAIAGLCLVVFVVNENRRAAAGRPVLFEMALFRLPSFGIGNASAFLVSLGEFGLIFVLPLYLQGALGYSALESGFIILAMALGAFLAGGAAAELARRFGAKRVVVTGMTLEVSGIILLAVAVSPEASGLVLALPLALYGFGLGLDSAQLTSVILEDVPTDQSGQASGMQSTSRQLGSAMGVAIIGAALAASLSITLAGDFASLGLPEGTDAKVESAIIDSGGAALIGMRTDPAMASAVEAGAAGFATATTWVLLLAGGFYVVGLLVSLRLPNAPRRDPGTGGA